MNKRIFIGIGVILVLVVVGLAAYVLRPTPEASVPIEALPINDEQKNEVVSEPVVEEPVDENALAPSEGEDLPPTDTSSTQSGTLIFSILQDQSEVRFTLDEVLRGAPKTVIGVTDQVAGEIVVDFNNPSNSEVGAILINARTFKTDNDFRNRAINNEILDTGTFEFITFTPSSLDGFPENPQFGDTFSFQITGEMTIRDISHQVTFDMTVTAVSENQLVGYGSTMVARADYDLKIPSIPNVADVDEEVQLEIEFVAAATQ